MSTSPTENSPAGNIVELSGATKDYPLGNTLVHALRGVDLAFGGGEFTVVAGPSGSGKSTLLNLVGCMDVPTAGTVRIDGKLTSELSDKQLTHLRLHRIGFIFQSFNLIAVLNVRQNVEFPLILRGGLTKAERLARVDEIISRVGIREQAKQRPSELSGGQRQRVAIARALVTRPALVLADEPTANLDTATTMQIIDLMHELNRDVGTTFIFSTHDHRVMNLAERRIDIEDGKVVGDVLIDPNKIDPTKQNGT